MLVKVFTLFSLTFSLFAATETVQSFDLNGDGVNDRFEYSVKAKLIRVEEDLNNDGKIDAKTTFTNKKSFKIEEQDTNYDGSFDRKKTFSYYANDKIKVLVEVAGIGYTQILPSRQTKNLSDCYNSFANQTLTQLISDGFRTISKAENGFIPTNFGYRIDQVCIDRWGEKFISTVEKMISGGLKCLMDLHQKSGVKNISGSLKNAYTLSGLMKKGGVSLVCSETKGYNWTATVANASTNNRDEIVEPKVKHPYISINPNYPKSKWNSDYAELAATLFHEQLHNLGISHIENIDYAYTCEDCCLNNEISDDAKALACKICTGDYKNEVDEKYVADFIDYTKKTDKEHWGFYSVMRFMKEHPKSLRGLTMLAYSSSDAYNPIGPELAKIIKERHPKLNEKENRYLEIAIKHDKSKRFNGTSEAAKVVAEALYEVYYNRDAKAALDLFEKNLVILKKELEKQKAKGVLMLPADSLYKALNKILYDLWVNRFPDGSNYDRAMNMFDAVLSIPKSK